MPVKTDLLAHLTQQQREAILHVGGPLLIIAGPGSGKTEVIAWRVAHLVGSGQTAPANCLVLTFANKAAQGLQDRIHQKLPDIDVEQIPIGTIHSLCAEILRSHQTQSSLPRGFEILDADDQLLFLYRNRAEVGLGGMMKGRPQDFYAAVLRMFNLATEELVRPEKLLDWCHAQEKSAETAAAEAAAGKSKTKAQKAADAVEIWKEEAIITQAYSAYCDLLRSRNLVDFAFLQRHCLDLLDSHPDVVDTLRNRYQAILVDEYQDTNAAQDRILQHLAGDGRHLTVVGDDDQSIYRFRGATVGNLLSFEKRYPGAKKVLLERNFRSHDPIVKSSLSVIINNTARFPKDLFTTRGDGSDIVLVYEHTVADEASAIARLLTALKAAGKIKRWSDVALLLRSVRSYSDDYMQALTRSGIPANVIGAAGFFARSDISQLCDLFHFLGAAKPWADVHVRCPLMGLNEHTIKALEGHKGSLDEIRNEKTLQSIGIKNAVDQKKILGLLDLKRRVKENKLEGILSACYELLALAGYVQQCQKTHAQASLMNLGVLSKMASRFDAIGGTRNIYPFLEYLGLLAAAGVEEAQEANGDAVRIMTIHQAKGLEFPVVVLPSAMEGRLPALRRRDRYEVPYELRASGWPEVDDPHLSDERKLFYVAATRPRELLILGTADIVNKRGGGPSQFLSEMLGNDIKAIANADRARILEAESTPGPTVEPRPRISFSQLVYFLQCPVRYELAVVCGLETLPPGPVGFGANVHRALLFIHELAIAAVAIDDHALEEAVERSWLSSAAPSKDSTQERDAKKAAFKQLRRYVQECQPDLRRVDQAELPFSFGVEQSILLGRIDLIRKDGDGIEVVDFKTGLASEERPEQEQLELQLGIYSLGAEPILGKSVTKCTAHFLRDGAVKSCPWSPDKASQTRERLSGMLQRIAVRQFEPRTAFCSRCSEFRKLCMYAGGKE
jgi:ATP-dependent DNA helicase UvrD/PcrA